MFGIEVRDSWERQQSEERAWTPRKHSKGNWCYWGKIQISPVFDKGFRNSYPSNMLDNNTWCVHARFGWGLGARRRKSTVESPESMAYAKPTCSIVKGGSEIIFLILASLLSGVSGKRKIGTSTENFLFLTWDSIWVVQTPSFPGFLGLKSHLRDLLEYPSWYWSISYGGP